MLFFQDTRLPVKPGEQYGPEEIEGIKAERRQNRSLAIFWGIVAVPASLIALVSFALSLIMLFRLTFGRGAMVEFFLFGIVGAVLLTPAYLFRQFWNRKRDLDEVLASQSGETGEPVSDGDGAGASAAPDADGSSADVEAPAPHVPSSGAEAGSPEESSD